MKIEELIHFKEMLHGDSLKIAQPFLNEEAELLRNLIIEYSAKVFLGVGSGFGLYFEIVSPHCRYIGIDPCYKQYYPKIIKKKFQDVQLKRRNEKFIISFIFNLISHVEENDIIHFLNENSQEGDIMTFSNWSENIIENLSLQQ